MSSEEPALGADPATWAFLRRLIDDAGLFPPARLPMAAALAAYGRARRSRYAWIQGRFLCPASRLDELAATRAGGDLGAGWTVGVILDRRSSPDWETAVAVDLDAVDRFAARTSDAVRIDVVETPLPLGADAAAAAGAIAALGHRLPPTVTPYFEVPAAEPALVGAIAAARAHPTGSRAGVKLRCGGLAAHAVPTPEEVAGFLAACAARGVPAKATAGLHHPVRHHDTERGWWEHGFVNLVGAAVLAAAGEAEVTLARVLGEDDPAALRLGPDGFAWRARTAGTPAIVAGRSLLVAYGSCSFEEPVQGLIGLGILP